MLVTQRLMPAFVKAFGVFKLISFQTNFSVHLLLTFLLQASLHIDLSGGLYSPGTYGPNYQCFCYKCLLFFKSAG